MEKRILELALETLEQRKALLQSEIESIQAELKGRSRPAAAADAPAPRRRRRMSAALRKAQSERMKKFWELRRQKAAKGTKKSGPAKAKPAGKRGRPKKAEKQKGTKVPF